LWDGTGASGTWRDGVTGQFAGNYANDLADLGLRRLEDLLSVAPSRGVTGDLFYEATHAEVARREGRAVICTLNVSHFRPVAPDLEVVTP
jgi:hypothetical protein